MKGHLWKFVPVLLLAAACAHAPSPGAFMDTPEPITAEGSGPLDENNIPASRERAALDAQKGAVLRVAGLFMDETSRSEGAPLLETGLLKTPQLYVAKHKILSEWQDGASYRVSVRVWVRLAKVASALRSMRLAGPGASAPVAAFAQRGGADKVFSKAFSEAFARRSSMQLKTFPFTSDEALLAGPDAGLLEAASSAGADLLFLASASAAASGGGLDTGFFPSRAEAVLKVYDVTKGSEVLSLSSHANAIDASEPASSIKALASAGELLAQEAAAKAGRLVDTVSPVKITITGLDGLSTLEKLRNLLQNSDLSGLRVESYSEGVAVLSAVPGASDPHEFASSVLRNDALGLQLEGIGPQEIIFSLVR
jgi:hypothetical protein